MLADFPPTTHVISGLSLSRSWGCSDSNSRSRTANRIFGMPLFTISSRRTEDASITSALRSKEAWAIIMFKFIVVYYKFAL